MARRSIRRRLCTSVLKGEYSPTSCEMTHISLTVRGSNGLRVRKHGASNKKLRASTFEGYASGYRVLRLRCGGLGCAHLLEAVAQAAPDDKHVQGILLSVRQQFVLNIPLSHHAARLSQNAASHSHPLAYCTHS